MEPYLVIVLGYATWFYVLLLGIVYVRWRGVCGGVKPQQFTPYGAELSAFGNRVCRSHANMVENFGPLLAIVFAAYVTGQTAELNSLAYLFLALRISQSVTHWVSGTTRAMGLRGVFFFAQVSIQMYWIFALLT